MLAGKGRRDPLRIEHWGLEFGRVYSFRDVLKAWIGTFQGRNPRVVRRLYSPGIRSTLIAATTNTRQLSAVS